MWLSCGRQWTDGLKNAGREAKCFPPCSSASSIVAPLNRTAALGVLCRIGGGCRGSGGVQIAENALWQHLVLGIKNVPAHTFNGDNLKSEVLHLLQMRACLLDVRVDPQITGIVRPKCGQTPKRKPAKPCDARLCG